MQLPLHRRNAGTSRSGLLDGRYQCCEVLDGARSGTVVRASDSVAGGQVVLRIIPRQTVSDPRSFAPRFFADGARRVRLMHPHTLRVFDYGRTTTDDFFIAMEHVRAQTLTRLMSARGPLDAMLAALVCARVCESLEEAHSHGLVHGELSPGVLWVTGRGLSGLKVAGYGLLSDNQQREFAARTPDEARYAAPERLAGEQASPRSDVYGVGLLLFELLTARPAFTEDSVLRILLSQHHGGPCRGPFQRNLIQASPTLAAIIDRCLSPDPGDRYASATILRHAIEQHLHFATA